MIYLDHHAATPIDPVAMAAMRAAETVAWANPSSVHAAGRAAKRVLETAREQIARSIGAEPADIVLTSGGTEACNLGVTGVVDESKPFGVVSTVVEHPAVSAAIGALGQRGANITLLPARHGQPADPEQLRALLASSVVDVSVVDASVVDRRGRVGLVAVQWVNHETGMIWPIERYASICRDAGVPLFIDATQAWGKLPIDVATLGATAVAIAAHKAGGPAGAGALWVARGTELHAQVLGGGQERGRRAGSPDPVTHAGFGAVAATIGGRIAAQSPISARRDRLEAAAVALGGRVNSVEPRCATVTNLSFPGRTGAALVASLDLEGVCCSSGAACSSGLNEASPVLRAMYPDEPWRASSAVRFSLGPEVSDVDVEFAIRALTTVLARPAA